MISSDDICINCLNETDKQLNSTITDFHSLNYWCLTLVILPLVCIFGNSLVVVAVLNERSLKTTTNFLLVSLAVADVLVGALVMPFSLYIVMNNLRWYLDDVACNIFNVVDVAASTASISNLVAISFDRFYAVVFHTEYKTRKHQKRIYCIIIFTWVFSVGVGLPLGIGLNQESGDQLPDQEYHCGIVNPSYMLFSTIFAFYIPCLLMIIMYGFVFYRLNRRLRSIKLQEMAAGQMVQFGGNIGQILNNVYGAKDVKKDALCWAMPFLRTIEAEIEEDDSMSSDEIEELTTILQTLESGDNRIVKFPMENVGDGEQLSDSDFDENERRGNVSRWRNPPRVVQNQYRRWSRRRSVYKAKTKIIGMKDRALQLLMKLKSKQGMAIRKETRATKLVAIVLLLFLLCWLPFFTLNIYKVFSLWGYVAWNETLEIFFVIFTWLGYLNSCLNPLIYSLINRKFRLAFRKLLHLPIEDKSSRRLRTGASARANVEQTTNKMLSTAAQVRVNRAKRRQSAIPEDPTVNMYAAIAGVKKREEPASRARISKGLSLDHDRGSPRCRRAMQMQPLLYRHGSSDQGYDTSSGETEGAKIKVTSVSSYNNTVDTNHIDHIDVVQSHHVSNSCNHSQLIPLLPEDRPSSSHGESYMDCYRYEELKQEISPEDNDPVYNLESGDELL